MDKVAFLSNTYQALRKNKLNKVKQYINTRPELIMSDIEQLYHCANHYARKYRNDKLVNVLDEFIIMYNLSDKLKTELMHAIECRDFEFVQHTLRTYELGFMYNIPELFSCALYSNHPKILILLCNFIQYHNLVLDTDVVYQIYFDLKNRYGTRELEPTNYDGLTSIEKNLLFTSMNHPCLTVEYCDILGGYRYVFNRFPQELYYCPYPFEFSYDGSDPDLPKQSRRCIIL